MKFPKPTPRPKRPRKPLRRSRWGVSKSKKGTKHRRREREFGRMAFYSSLWCMVREMAMNGNAEPRHRDEMLACDGPIEVAHLGARAGYRRCPDSETAPLCRKHHRGIDGTIGGRARWYVELGREGLRKLRDRLILFAKSYWDYLTDEGRARWNAVAAEQMARRR